MRTAVEQIFDELHSKGLWSSKMEQIFEPAKEMEKEQIIDFAYDIADDLACGVLSKKDIEDRYNEFFKSE